MNTTMQKYRASSIVDGHDLPSANTVDNLDPANGQVIGQVDLADIAAASSAVAAARHAFESTHWSASPRVRQTVLMQWAQNLSARAEELALLLTHENGKVIAQSRGEVQGAISEINYYAGLCRHIVGTSQEVSPGVMITSSREAAGVVTIIVPWNAPVGLLVRSLAPALAAGCTAVIKPAWQTALVTYQVVKELTRIPGFPPGAVNVVTETGAEISKVLCTAEDVDVISFTGSNVTGQLIYAAAAPTMKKLSLELGDKAACIVFDDVDMDRVMTKLAAAATIISGQQCTAARRILVHESVFALAKESLTRALSSLRVGPGWLEGMHLGAMIDVPTRNAIKGKVEDAMDRADEVLLRGTTLEASHPDGAFMTPTLIAHEDTKASFVQEEIFGPLVVIESFQDEQEAAQRANDTLFGLSASVWTADGARAARMARSLRRGTIWINNHNQLMAEAETGGFRRSGVGRLHGYEALNDFTETKIVYQDAGTL